MEASEADAASEEDQVPAMEPVFVPGRPLTTVQRTERLSRLIRAGVKRKKVSDRNRKLRNLIFFRHVEYFPQRKCYIFCYRGFICKNNVICTLNET